MSFLEAIKMINANGYRLEFVNGKNGVVVTISEDKCKATISKTIELDKNGYLLEDVAIKTLMALQHEVALLCGKLAK